MKRSAQPLSDAKIKRLLAALNFKRKFVRLKNRWAKEKWSRRGSISDTMEQLARKNPMYKLKRTSPRNFFTQDIFCLFYKTVLSCHAQEHAMITFVGTEAEFPHFAIDQLDYEEFVLEYTETNKEIDALLETYSNLLERCDCTGKLNLDTLLEIRNTNIVGKLTKAINKAAGREFTKLNSDSILTLA